MTADWNGIESHVVVLYSSQVIVIKQLLSPDVSCVVPPSRTCAGDLAADRVRTDCRTSSGADLPGHTKAPAMGRPVQSSADTCAVAKKDPPAPANKSKTQNGCRKTCRRGWRWLSDTFPAALGRLVLFGSALRTVPYTTEAHGEVNGDRTRGPCVIDAASQRDLACLRVKRPSRCSPATCQTPAQPRNPALAHPVSPRHRPHCP